VSLSRKILLALVFGILFGLFLGEMAAPLKVVGDAFIQLLQMTVLPYIMFSLITSLGRLSYQQAKTLAVKVGSLLLLLWGMALILVFTFPLAFPSWESASFFSTTLVQGVQDVDFLDRLLTHAPNQSTHPSEAFVGQKCDAKEGTVQVIGRQKNLPHDCEQERHTDQQSGIEGQRGAKIA